MFRFLASDTDHGGPGAEYSRGSLVRSIWLLSFFLRHTHSLLMSVLGCRSANEGQSHRRRPSGYAVGRGGSGHGGTGHDRIGKAVGVEARGGTSSCAGEDLGA